VDIADDMRVYSVPTTDRLINAADGTVRKSAGSGAATSFGVAIDNTGRIEGQAGLLWLANGGTVGGQILVSNAATVQLLGGAFVLTPYTFSGAGFFGLSAGSDVTLSGTLSEAMGWNDGTLRGEFTISPLGSLRVWGSADRHFNGVVTNHGLVDFMDDMKVYSIAETDRLINAPDGTLRKSAGSVVATDFGAATDNYGVTEGGVGLLSFVTGYQQLSGTTRLVNGARIQSVNGFRLAGGELSGNGTFLGSVTNNGAVRPGNGAASITIDGDYVQGQTAH